MLANNIKAAIHYLKLNDGSTNIVRLIVWVHIIIISQNNLILNALISEFHRFHEVLRCTAYTQITYLPSQR